MGCRARQPRSHAAALDLRDNQTNERDENHHYYDLPKSKVQTSRQHAHGLISCRSVSLDISVPYGIKVQVLGHTSGQAVQPEQQRGGIWGEKRHSNRFCPRP